MKKQIRLQTGLVLLLSLFVAFASSAHSVERSFPGQFVFPTNENASGLQEVQIRKILSLLDESFGSEIHNTSKSWTSGFDWMNPNLGAGSIDYEGNYTVMLWGGLLRARYMTLGAAAAVICHELGHKLGGAPYQKFPGQDRDWSSAEGQADTFAASLCLPKLYDQLMRKAPELLQASEEPSVQKLCQQSKEPEKCQWVASSGIDLIETLQVYYETDLPFADPLKTAKEEPAETLTTNYPSYQCRMDTYKAAAQNPLAQRLRCWFKEN